MNTFKKKGSVIYSIYKITSNFLPMDWIIAGLGNPGKSYTHHRHNVGFWALKMLHEYWDASSWIVKKEALLSKTQVGEKKIALCCPQTYMNLSGQAIAPLFRQYPGAQFLVIHDELDLPCGQWRWKLSGSPRGHNGLKSIHTILGEEYTRIRIGIDRPADKNTISDYVLHSPNLQDRHKIDDVLKELPKAIEAFILGK